MKKPHAIKVCMSPQGKGHVEIDGLKVYPAKCNLDITSSFTTVVLTFQTQDFETLTPQAEPEQ